MGPKRLPKVPIIPLDSGLSRACARYAHALPLTAARDKNLPVDLGGRSTPARPKVVEVIHYVVLGHRDEVVGDPVDEQPDGESPRYNQKGEGQDAHEPSLLGLDVPRRYLHRKQHGHGGEYGQDEIRIARREVHEP